MDLLNSLVLSRDGLEWLDMLIQVVDFVFLVLFCTFLYDFQY